MLLALAVGWMLDDGWLVLSIGLYLLTGACWLPVVVIQIRLRRLARAAAETGSRLPPAYHRLFRIWFLCGIPAFTAVLTIIWLMLAKPEIVV